MSVSTRIPLLFVVVSIICLSLAVGCDSGGDDESEPDPADETESPAETASPSVSGPVGVVAIGHSGMTGTGTINLGHDAPENSWVTGDNPEVNSIYQRMVEARRETKGHVANAAETGAEALRLAPQAQRALTEVPQPEIVIIQTIDNDIQCDGTDEANVPGFGTAVSNALNVITDASPETKVLILSDVGTPSTFADAVGADAALLELNSGTSLCHLFNPDGQRMDENIARLTAILALYKAELERVCAEFPQCQMDGGVANQHVDTREGLVDDGHLSIAGHAAFAELMWPTVATALGIATE